jgi:hypothetical protein
MPNILGGFDILLLLFSSLKLREKYIELIIFSVNNKYFIV